MRRAILERFRNDHGDRNIATLDERALKAILAKLSPLAALNWLKTLRSLLRHAIDVIEARLPAPINERLNAAPISGSAAIPSPAS
jgi:hypothetical protein